ncbi:CBS-domain-containing protein [Geoglobus acetivorans]|uniref:CBS-domain-containing protein n=2 Tax=Geoglobus acetivorans TaxID=565033 RepID=A0A0A7GBF6_GEOAI|nr:CBS-domain-containing protein [Geoglobus acetivorans]
MNAESLLEVITDEYSIINADETISKVISMLAEYEHERPMLVEKGGEIIGAIREKDLIRGSLMTNPDETKIGRFAAKTGIIRPDELTPEKVARRFIEDSTPFVPVKLDGETGIIRINDFLERIKDEFKGTEIQSVMNPDVITVKTSDGASKALAIMRNHGISRVVVVNSENKVAGIITGKDIIDRVVSLKKDDGLGYLSMKEKEKTLSIPVESIMSQPVVTVKKNDRVVRAIDLMIEKNVSSLVVMENDVAEGIVVKKDFLEYYLRMTTSKEQNVQIVSKGITLRSSEVEGLLEDLDRFLMKFKDSLGTAHLFVYVKKLKRHYRDLPLIYVRMRLRSDQGDFFVTSESWGVEFAVHAALSKLERLVVKDKELVLNRRIAQKIYEEEV